MAVVLVTGSSGLIGRAVVKSLARTFQMVGFDREGWPHPPREAEVLAKAGAWLEDRVPGEEHFIKPWMIDLADDHYALDIRRARKILGWEPKRSLRETLPRMVSALEGDPLLFYKKNELEAPSWIEHKGTRTG